MTRAAEAEAWVHRSRRMIHNQSLIQFLSAIAIIVPLPIAVFVFWVSFGLASPIMIQSIVAIWAASTIVYTTLAIHARIQRRKP